MQAKRESGEEKKEKKRQKQNRPNNKVISSSNLLSDKYGARDTLNFHYVALFLFKEASAHVGAHADFAGRTRSQARGLLMVNACNVTVPCQAARSLAAEKISFHALRGQFIKKKKKKCEMKITKGHCAIFMCYQKGEENC